MYLNNVFFLDLEINFKVLLQCFVHVIDFRADGPHGLLTLVNKILSKDEVKL